jgi:hypothetical protein
MAHAQSMSKEVFLSRETIKPVSSPSSTLIEGDYISFYKKIQLITRQP